MNETRHLAEWPLLPSKLSLTVGRVNGAVTAVPVEHGEASGPQRRAAPRIAATSCSQGAVRGRVPPRRRPSWGIIDGDTP